MRASILLDCRNAHGEGAVWSAEHDLLYWTDITGERVSTFDPRSGATRTYPVPGRVGCLAPRAGREPTQVVAAFADAFALLDLDAGRREDIAAFEPQHPTTRLNDGRTDRQGRFVAGGMNEDGLKPISSVWRLDPDLSTTLLIEEVGCANSTCFSPDGRTMYFADSAAADVFAYGYDPATGMLGARTLMAALDPGRGVPDGSCVDRDGFLWTAVWDGYRVERRAPDGRLDQVVEVPVRKPTCCTFGGPDLATLFITTSRLGEDAARLAREPEAGSLFAVRPGPRGIADQPFAG